MRTLNGYPISELTTILDQPLPPTAYKQIPGGAGLTDIDAGWQRRAFNKIFGVYGLGWGFDFRHEHIDIRHELNAKEKLVPFAKVYGKFWFAYKDESGVHKVEFPVTGANSNQSGTGAEGYTLKGAITNAIGFGASMIGWQESVYLGARSHNNTEGFADGKDWCNITPEDVTIKEQATAPVAPVEPVAPAKIIVSYCDACLRILSGTCKPSVCQCSGTKLVECVDTDSARRAVNKISEQRSPKKPVITAPAPVVIPPPAEPTAEAIEPETTAADPSKSLAEKLGFESMKHAVCIQCGYCEPVNALPEACPSCGVVAPWTVAPSHAVMLQMSANIKAKLDINAEAAKSKNILESLKQKYDNNRRLLLQALSTAAGRKINNYSECSPEEMQKALDTAGSTGDSNAAPADTGNSNTPAATTKPVTTVATPAKPMDKVELSSAIFAAAALLKLGGPRSVITEVGKVAGKTINSTAQLDETELLAVLKDFQGRLSA